MWSGCSSCDYTVNVKLILPVDTHVLLVHFNFVVINMSSPICVHVLVFILANELPFISASDAGFKVCIVLL